VVFCRRRSFVAAGLAGALALAVPVLAAGPSGAAIVHGPLVNPVGTYTFDYLLASSPGVTVNADHTWTDGVSGFGGTWAVEGREIVLGTVGPNGGCVFLGRVSKAGINSATTRGPYNCPSSLSGSWYAVRTGPAPRRVHLARGTPGPGRHRFVASPSGNYHATFSQGAPSGLQIGLPASSFGYALVDLGDAGTWVHTRKYVGMITSTSGGSANDVGCVYIARYADGAFGSVTAPGSYNCPGRSVANQTWYATP